MKKRKVNLVKILNLFGTITADENTSTGSVKTTHDIFMITDEMPDKSIVQKYYDEDKNFIAGRDKDGKLYPSSEFSNEDLSFLSQFENSNKPQGISLKEFDKKLEKVAKSLGISKAEILAMSEVDLSQAVSTTEKPQLSLDKKETENEEINNQQNEEMLKNIPSKEEINLNQKVDDRHSLAQILGVPEGSKLIAVDSSYIANNKSTTRFSLIIMNPDGHLETADMLKQVGGDNSDRNVYETNYDGSEVEKKVVRSSYEIDSPIVENGIINIRYDSLGYIELDYGQTDPTSHKDAFTQKLETSRDCYRTTREVREEFKESNGEYNISDNLDELKSHEEHDCNNLTLEDADGKPETGHNHEEILVEIKSYDSVIGDVFTDREIEDRLHTISENNPDKSFEEILLQTKRDLSEDASHIRNHNHQQ